MTGGRAAEAAATVAFWGPHGILGLRENRLSPPGDIGSILGVRLGTDSPDKLISAPHSELEGVGGVDVDGVQTHLLLLLLGDHQFP